VRQLDVPLRVIPPALSVLAKGTEPRFVRIRVRDLLLLPALQFAPSANSAPQRTRLTRITPGENTF